MVGNVEVSCNSSFWSLGKTQMAFVNYLSSHAGLHTRPHAGVSPRVFHLHGHALPRLIHKLGENRVFNMR